MKVSSKMVVFLKECEGLRLKTYKDTKGKLTIGWGHTSGVKEDQEITAEQAEAFLKSDIETAERQLDGLGLTFTPGQYDALVDFIFNIGFGRFKESTLLKQIRLKAPTSEIQYQFKRWKYSGGVVLPGLVKRRAWEALRWAETN